MHALYDEEVQYFPITGFNARQRVTRANKAILAKSRSQRSAAFKGAGLSNELRLLDQKVAGAQGENIYQGHVVPCGK